MTLPDIKSATIKVSDTMSHNLVTVQEDDRVSTAADRLISRNVGSVLVMNQNDEVVGIITKGDIVREIVIDNKDSNRIRAKEIMSSQLVTINCNNTIEEASSLMAQKQISKLPVLKDGNLCGIITASDIIRAHPFHVEYLEELVHARSVSKDSKKR